MLFTYATDFWVTVNPASTGWQLRSALNLRDVLLVLQSPLKQESLQCCWQHSSISYVSTCILPTMHACMRKCVEVCSSNACTSACALQGIFCHGCFYSVLSLNSASVLGEAHWSLRSARAQCTRHALPPKVPVSFVSPKSALELHVSNKVQRRLA